MNVGYTKLDDKHMDMVCPLCGSNIYGSKHGNDYKCINVNCVLRQGARTVMGLIKKSLED